MLSFRLIKSIVDILKEFIFNFSNILLRQQFGKHHRRTSHPLLLLFLLRHDHTPIWRAFPSLESEVNLDISEVFEDMLYIGPAFGPELIDGCLFHQHPVPFLAGVIEFELLVETTEQVRVYVLEKTFNEVLNVGLDIGLKNIYKFILLEGEGLEPIFKDLKAVFDD